MADKSSSNTKRKAAVLVERASLSRVTDIRLPVEFKKATGAIHIAPKSRITLVQRKAFNVLLANALFTNEKLEQQTFSISLPFLLQELAYDANNASHIKAALRHLNVLQVQWDVIDADGRDKWGVATMISEAEITGNTLYYSFAQRTKAMLLDPEFYGRISLEIQKQFQSQYAFALYENCVRFCDVGKTSLLSVVEWRDLLNAIGDYYLEFKNFSRRVLKPAIEEVNEVSDIDIRATYVYEGKSVTHIQFHVQRKKQTQMRLDVNTPIDVRLEKKLAALGFDDSGIAELVNQYEAEFIWSTLAQFDEALTLGKKQIKSKAAYFSSMLKNNNKNRPQQQAVAKPKKPTKDPGVSAPVKPVSEPATPGTGALTREELLQEFQRHQRDRAMELFEALDEIEQEAHKGEFVQSSNQPVAIIDAWKKSGIRSKLVRTAFSSFLVPRLLTALEDTDVLSFAIAQNLISR